MKKSDYIILVVLIALSIYIALEVYPPIRSRIERNCNQIGGSYLGGHCIRNF